MGRRTVSNSFLQPVTMTTGVLVAEAPGTDANIKERGAYTLAAGTYFFMLDGADAANVSAHLVYDAACAFVAKIEDCNFPPEKVNNYDDGSTGVTAGFWVDEDPTTAFVGSQPGTGDTITNGVLTHTAGAQGGAMFHVNGTGARRTRLRVTVTTGGEFMCAAWAKE